jgi:hypothetical protein
MIEVKTERYSNFVRHKLFVHGVKVPPGQGSVFGRTDALNQTDNLVADIYGALTPQAATSRFSDVSTQISTLSLVYHSHLHDELYLGTVQAVRVKVDKFDVYIICFIKPGGWKYAWSIEEYIAEFSKRVSENSSSGVQWVEKASTNIYMNTFELRLPLVEGATLTIEAVVQKFIDSIKQLHELTQASLRSKFQPSDVEHIIRSIEFPPEYYHSGITILSYFTDVLRQKNLSEHTTVSIEQSGLNVRLVIQTSTGQRELIERTLESYALVVTGKQPIETLTHDPYEMMELKNQLRIASVQIENQRDMLALKKAEVTNLRSEIEDTKTSLKRLEQNSREDSARFMSMFETLVQHNADLSSGFRELAQQAVELQNRNLVDALESLHKMVERGVQAEDQEEAIKNLRIIQQEDPNIFKRVHDVLVLGAVSGAAGNYLYAWLQFIVGSMPR